jgi:hypothetical protein
VVFIVIDMTHRTLHRCGLVPRLKQPDMVAITFHLRHRQGTGVGEAGRLETVAAPSLAGLSTRWDRGVWS